MREFFRGWKRKLGVATLLSALVLLGAWGASSNDVKLFSFNASVLDSFDGSLYWQRIHDKSPDIQRKFRAWGHEESYRLRDIPGMTWRWNILGMGVCEYLSPRSDLRILILPYWSLAIPMTLLSAYLLLSKPRVNQPEPALET